MATVPFSRFPRANDYPTTDGKPMGETDFHHQDMTDLIETLQLHYRDDSQVYVSGNMLMYYIPGNKRKHVSPDVFIVRGIAKHMRDNYLVWEVGKGPDLVIELTSKSTRKEDVKDKFKLYQGTLKVSEYFLFDPKDEYLDPYLQGYRLTNGKYLAIRSVKGRLPSKVMGVHLERHEHELRLYNPETRQWLPTPVEAAHLAESARQQAERELARLRQEIERLRGGSSAQP